MDLESECSVLESVEDNEEIRNDSVSKKSGNVGEPKVQNNGSCVVENNDSNELFPEVKEKEAEVLGSGNEPCVDLNREVSPSPTMTRRGHGLKKWRRIKRDVNWSGDYIINTGKMVKQELSNSDVQSTSSKRAQTYAGRNRKSEGSVSSTNAVLRNLDGFSLDDSGLGLSPSFAVGTDSENSEDRSSRSSTAASVPKIKFEKPVIVGFPHDKSRMRSLSGKNLTHSVQRGQHGKGRIEATKKARGERIKIEKENSHSSVESDLRSSNFVFVQGTCSTNNGLRSGGPKDYDGENGDEVQGNEREVSDGHHRDGEGGYGDMSSEDVVADSSWERKGERSENHGSSSDQDLLAESIFALQSAQEALEKEVLKFKEISEDASVIDSLSDSEHLPYGDGIQSNSRSVQSEVAETANREVENELENLFKQKIEAEVEYLTILRTVQNLRVSAVDQITVIEETKALASEQTQILEKLGNAEHKAAILKKEAEKLENVCEDIVSADETLKLQKKVCKYSSCLIMQLVLLAVVLGVFMLQSSPDYVEVVPT
ncbi:hypothetical protein BUALT_Bualt03G0161800 [Buddleja alternifolia]|uniref:WPP domain-interacting protein 2 n=1 Tax=Buddleja alternifolia TaxID=168488 RepID=A0AAV6Y2P0_9LAMI|nr:hypothetical protein BUALT_Bualt03G0161800 [Buddleja alternifolia]